MATANFINQREFKLYVRDDSDMDEVLAEEFQEEFDIIVEDYNDLLDYYTVTVISGHYGGIQFYVEPNNQDEIDIAEMNEDEFGSTRVINHIRKEQEYINETVLPQLANRLGFEEIRLVAQASNGEAFYEKVDKE